MLNIENVSLEFLRYDKKILKKDQLKIISNVNLYIRSGEIVAIIGSSGSGKSLLAHSILGILPKNVILSGKIEFKTEALTEQRKKNLRGKEIALIPQSINFLDPLQTVGKQVYRSAYLNTGDHAAAKQLRDEAFSRYKLNDSVKDLFPFQVSGGMARRVLTAMATVSQADLIIADEPTTGLDPAAINESLAYLRTLADNGKAIMLITHDIKTALQYADTIAVFYGGTTVEIASAADFNDISNLRHPYTKELYYSLPQNEFSHIPGLNPFGEMITQGCVFEPRCRNGIESCKTDNPYQKTINNGRVWCHHA